MYRHLNRLSHNGQSTISTDLLTTPAQARLHLPDRILQLSLDRCVSGPLDLTYTQSRLNGSRLLSLP